MVRSKKIVDTLSDMLQEANGQFILMKENVDYKTALMNCANCLDNIVNDPILKCESYRIVIDEDTTDIRIDLDFKYSVEFNGRSIDLPGAILNAKEISFEQTNTDIITLSVVYPGIWEFQV